MMARNVSILKDGGITGAALVCAEYERFKIGGDDFVKQIGKNIDRA
jgi:hypothetical protein